MMTHLLYIYGMLHSINQLLPARSGQRVDGTEGCLDASNHQALVFGVSMNQTQMQNSRFVITTPLNITPGTF